jgi:hypothetical protein
VNIFATPIAFSSLPTKPGLLSRAPTWSLMQMRFAVFSQTATKNTANGNPHTMLKVIQHGVTIAKY